MLVCPQCGGRDLRYSRLRTVSERCWTWFGIRPLRCRDCRLRFLERTWRLGNIRFARCPMCWRMDLARWSEEDYYVPALKKLLLRTGAKPYRCAYCRVNFVSFRPRLMRYRSSHRPHEAVGQPVAAAKGQAAASR
jgi:hypothetical protein